LTQDCRGGIILVMRIRPLLLALVLVAVAGKLIQLGITRAGVGPFEYLTLALLVALLLQSAFRLSRRAFRRA
jgi:hypothetical protein